MESTQGHAINPNLMETMNFRTAHRDGKPDAQHSCTRGLPRLIHELPQGFKLVDKIRLEIYK